VPYSDFVNRLRAFEDKILANLDRIACPCHLSLGAEAVSEAIYENIQKEDWLFSTHRNHGHYLAKGGNPDRLWDEICGLDTGINGGYAGSQSFSDPSINFHASSIVGGSIGIAVGTALACKGTGNLVVCCFGDAATEQGVFWEAIGFSVVKQIPILFICENNGLSIDVPIHERQPHKETIPAALWWRVTVWGMKTVTTLDYKQAFKDARTEPVFLEAKVKREGRHCYFPKESTPL
jgi:pyruvate dehydrogenase E1 component alpha subunit